MSRAVATIVLVVALLVQGCARSLPRSSSAPVQVQPFQRVWVAGFVTGDGTNVDVNATTVRLLRAELQRRGLEAIAGEPLELKTTDVFQAASYWRQYWDEYRASVIVTGTMELKHAPPRVTQLRGRAAGYLMEPGFFLESQIRYDKSDGNFFSRERGFRSRDYQFTVGVGLVAYS